MVTTFGAFTFDDATRELRCGGRHLHLSPKAFELLGVLLRARPSAVSKTDLHQALWPDSFVSDGSLPVLVAEVRRALGDSAHAPVFIRTLSRFGYAFSADAQPTQGDRAADHLHCFVASANGRVTLKPGENVLGRDPAADVFLDAVGVSRRHAVITVTDRSVSVRDLSSKNGTFVNGTRIGSVAPLEDQAEIRLGAVSVVFRRAPAAGPTQTVT